MKSLLRHIMCKEPVAEHYTVYYLLNLFSKLRVFKYLSTLWTVNSHYIWAGKKEYGGVRER